MQPPPPPPPPPRGGEGGSSRKRAKCPDLRKKKSLLSEGFVLTISVGDQDRFRRRDQVPARVDQMVKRIAAKRGVFHLGRREQRGKEVLLLARTRTELAGDRLLHAEPRLISTAAGLMRVEIGDGRESVEERLAVVTSTTLKQLRESSHVVESPRGHSVGIGTSPTCEQ